MIRLLKVETIGGRRVHVRNMTAPGAWSNGVFTQCGEVPKDTFRASRHPIPLCYGRINADPEWADEACVCFRWSAEAATVIREHKLSVETPRDLVRALMEVGFTDDHAARLAEGVR